MIIPSGYVNELENYNAIGLSRETHTRDVIETASATDPFLQRPRDSGADPRLLPAAYALVSCPLYLWIWVLNYFEVPLELPVADVPAELALLPFARGGEMLDEGLTEPLPRRA